MMAEKACTFAWDAVSVAPSALLSFLRRERAASIEVLFFYADKIYAIGVAPENRAEPFFFEEDSYPSVLALSSTASIEGGFLLPDLKEKLSILAVNGENPAPFFHGVGGDKNGGNQAEK